MKYSGGFVFRGVGKMVDNLYYAPSGTVYNLEDVAEYFRDIVRATIVYYANKTLRALDEKRAEQIERENTR